MNTVREYENRHSIVLRCKNCNQIVALFNKVINYSSRHWFITRKDMVKNNMFQFNYMEKFHSKIYCECEKLLGKINVEEGAVFIDKKTVEIIY